LKNYGDLTAANFSEEFLNNEAHNIVDPSALTTQLFFLLKTETCTSMKRHDKIRGQTEKRRCAEFSAVW
jgi:hypothetical protein